MNVAKRVRFWDTVDAKKSPSRQMTAEEDKSNVTELALALVNRAVTAAIKAVEEAENPIKNIKWITHGEFTAERGRRQIEEFVLTWEYQDCWVHYTDFIKREDLIHSFRYIYSVRWSLPTAQRPMLQVSASAHFSIKINKNKPPDAPIDVSYVFEGQSLVHR
ncbi:PREDICTED: A-kinase anchor protein 14 [Ceratotherium simum simum]|uniref:A-kinase anchor protein 14 n=1 Tax=Ceratotherium simum simum TaxID=73337 RepID=A0ABM1DK01_CERSS|nr:PREDICTED: A-kinase anchor protein 14 [Ceratotherium simum simum]XP_014652133.1 PREDICTED: A-kinase anchor protein 14 [Ceratotherium simum simum]